MLKELVTTDNLRASNYCGGCGTLIRDRFYLLAVDRAWHGQCLRCSKCSQPLDAELRCFIRDGNIYCKKDYFKLFSSRRCARCDAGISSSELVMRARELVFHVDCFSCALCGIHLSAGDTAAIRSGQVLCGEHYDVDILSESNSVSTVSQFYANNSSKGRPRKRKSSIHHSDESSDILDRGSTPMRIELHHNDILQSSLDMTTYDDSQSPGSSGSISGQTRTKRMRTSFKHHQLRTMKSYFAINQNPDAKDLKQLAQKTSLSKRVLQVWFQNARAKWRRNVMRQEAGGNGQNQMVSSSSSSSSSGNLSTGGPNSAARSDLANNNNNNNNETVIVPSSHTLQEIHHMTFAELF